MHRAGAAAFRICWRPITASEQKMRSNLQATMLMPPLPLMVALVTHWLRSRNC